MGDRDGQVPFQDEEWEDYGEVPGWMRVFGTPYSLLRVTWMVGSMAVGYLIGFYVL